MTAAGVIQDGGGSVTLREPWLDDVTSGATDTARAAALDPARSDDFVTAPDVDARRAVDDRPDVWRMRYRRTVAVSDGVAVVLGIASALLAQPWHWAAHSAARSTGLIAVVIAVLGVWLLLLRRNRHRSDRTGIPLTDNLAVIGSGGAVFAGACAALVLAGVSVPRSLIVMPFVVGTALVVMGRGFSSRWLTRQRDNGRCLHTAIVVGDLGSLGEVGSDLTARIGFRIVGACVTDGFAAGEIACEAIPPGMNEGPRPIPVLGTASRVVEIALAHGVDAVVVASSPATEPGFLRRLSWDLDAAGISLSVISPLSDVAPARVRTERHGALTVLHVAGPTYRGAARAGKRIVDIAGSLALLVVAALPMAVIAGAVKLTSPGPVLFRQERVGFGDKRFTMLKFRSMVEGAESQLADVQQQQDAGNVVLFKMKNDPRVTAVGKLLRKVSLDELPQLVNVLRGEMSLVGPRPALPAEIAKIGAETAERRRVVKPGMTGLWQVSGRSDLPQAESERCDRSYVENWSLRADASILARTLGALRKGAY